jgi:hypothetical protein
MSERPLCRDVSLTAAGECLVDAATHLRCAVSDVVDAVGFALIALFQGPTMRAVERPMPEPSAEALLRWSTATERARRQGLGFGELTCVCGDYPVAVGEPCAACAEVGA